MWSFVEDKATKTCVGHLHPFPQVDDDGLDAIGGIMYMPFGMMKLPPSSLKDSAQSNG